VLKTHKLTVCSNPWPDCDVRNSNTVTHDKAGPVLGQLLVEGAIETIGLIDVTVNRILELLRGIA
jgi:hypothetical protein